MKLRILHRFLALAMAAAMLQGPAALAAQDSAGAPAAPATETVLNQPDPSETIKIHDQYELIKAIRRANDNPDRHFILSLEDDIQIENIGMPESMPDGMPPEENNSPIEDAYRLEVSGHATLLGNGHSIIYSCFSRYQPVFTVKRGGVLNLGSPDFPGNSLCITADGRLLYNSLVVCDGELNMYPATAIQDVISASEEPGGGVAVKQNGRFTMYGGLIEKCEKGDKGESDHLYNGGGVGLQDSGATFIMRAGTIRHNTATFVGGGVYAPDGSTLQLLGGVISGNTAEYGGGIAADGCIVDGQISNMSIEGNSAGFQGGGIWLHKVGCDDSGNPGGGIGDDVGITGELRNIDEDSGRSLNSHNSLDIRNTEFTGNHIYNSLIFSSVPSHEGISAGAGLCMRDCQGMKLEGLTVHDNYLGYSSGYYTAQLYSGAGLSLLDCDSIAISGLTCSNNQMNYDIPLDCGAGLGLMGCSDVDITSSSISGNLSVDAGGGIGAAQCRNLCLTDVSVTKNLTMNRGAGILLTGDGIFEGSSADVVDFQFDCVLRNCLIKDNYVGYEIGSADPESESLQPEKEDDSPSSDGGGGIAVGPAVRLEMQGGVLCNNHVTNYGADLYLFSNAQLHRESMVTLPQASSFQEEYTGDDAHRMIDGWYNDNPAYDPSSSDGSQLVDVSKPLVATPEKSWWLKACYAGTTPTPETATITFRVVNGVWADGSTADKTVSVTLTSGKGTLDSAQVPTGMRPNSGYSGGSWDVTPNTSKDAVTKSLTYTYTFQPDGGSGGSGSSGGSSSSGRRYTLSYQSNGGTTYREETYSAGTSVSLSKTPTRDGYTFTGWYLDKKLTDKVTRVTMNADRTVYAGWQENGQAGTIPALLNGEDHFAYVSGYPDGTIRPLASITRGEIATIFYRLLQKSAVEQNGTSRNSFSDVSEGQWFNRPVSTIAKLGLVAGRPDGRFDPDAPITRAEFATICANFDKSSPDGGTPRFSDIGGCWAQAFIQRAAALGWVSGYEDGTFRPDAPISRAEAMCILNRMLNRRPEGTGDLLNGMKTWPDNADTAAWYYLTVQEASNGHTFQRKDGGVYERWTKLTA